MRLTHSFKTAFQGIAAHASRSLLTILGIVIGISAIMLIASTGKSTEALIVGELGGLGAETIVVRPGREPKGPTDFAQTLLSDSLKQRDLDALRDKNNVPYALEVSPEILVPGSVSYAGETFRPTILGFSSEFMERALNLQIADGTGFTDRDIRSKAQVAVIGDRVQKELFGNKRAVGEFIQIKGRKFRVAGVYAPRGQVVFFDVDELVIVPYTTAQTYLTGTKHFNQIIVRAQDSALVEQTVFDIQKTLRLMHRIGDPENDDFNVQTQQGLVQQISTIISVFTLFLSVVVAIALVVGGIGIMNIMLVSVSERTREIGLRKAVGATYRDILIQFLIEAVLLTTVGGTLGVAIGWALSLGSSYAISVYLGSSVVFAFPVKAAFVGLTSAIVVGLSFGLYPARQAALKSPIEALRYE